MKGTSTYPVHEFCIQEISSGAHDTHNEHSFLKPKLFQLGSLYKMETVSFACENRQTLENQI